MNVLIEWQLKYVSSDNAFTAHKYLATQLNLRVKFIFMFSSSLEIINFYRQIENLPVEKLFYLIFNLHIDVPFITL